VFAAPEIKERGIKKADGPKIDIWAVGMMLYLMFTGYTFDLEKEQKLNFEGKEWQCLSTQSKDFILRLL
jgi:serine/threonine protein kinase